MLRGRKRQRNALKTKKIDCDGDDTAQPTTAKEKERRDNVRGNEPPYQQFPLPLFLSLFVYEAQLKGD